MVPPFDESPMSHTCPHLPKLLTCTAYKPSGSCTSLTSRLRHTNQLATPWALHVGVKCGGGGRQAQVMHISSGAVKAKEQVGGSLNHRIARPHVVLPKPRSPHLSESYYCAYALKYGLKAGCDPQHTTRMTPRPPHSRVQRSPHVAKDPVLGSDGGGGQGGIAGRGAESVRGAM